MKTLLRVFLSCVCVLLVSPTFAWSAEVTMAFGLSLPPYVISESNSGMEMDIIREALAFRGHTLKPVYVPLARVPEEFKTEEIQAVQRDGGTNLTPSGGIYSNMVSITYHDVIVTLKERGLTVKTPDDLAKLSVVAFQGAINHYPKWLQPVKAAGKYYEQKDQLLQVKSLHVGRCDAILGDRNIVQYFTNQALKDGSFRVLPTELHEFTEPYGYNPAFKDPKIRDDFDAGIKHLQETGRYQEIINSYLQATP